jgi:hypothetical protein
MSHAPVMTVRHPWDDGSKMPASSARGPHEGISTAPMAGLGNQTTQGVRARQSPPGAGRCGSESRAATGLPVSQRHGSKTPNTTARGPNASSESNRTPRPLSRNRYRASPHVTNHPISLLRWVVFQFRVSADLQSQVGEAKHGFGMRPTEGPTQRTRISEVRRCRDCPAFTAHRGFGDATQNVPAKGTVTTKMDRWRSLALLRRNGHSSGRGQRPANCGRRRTRNDPTGQAFSRGETPAR